MLMRSVFDVYMVLFLYDESFWGEKIRRVRFQFHVIWVNTNENQIRLANYCVRFQVLTVTSVKMIVFCSVQ
jgi:hypothetical protein